MPGTSAGRDSQAGAARATRGGPLRAGAWALAAMALAGAPLVVAAARASGSRLTIGLFAAALAAAALALLPGDRGGAASAPVVERQAPLLLAVSRELGAGDLVQGLELARRLPSGVGERLAAAVASLDALADDLQDSSRGVAGAAERVDRSAAGLAAGAAEQAASAGEITAAMEELSRTAGEIAEHSQRQSDLLDRAQSEGAAGALAIADSVAGVAAIERRIAEITAGAETLGGRSRDIFRVLELISDIAQETHILSINAALESAAAGERGRRFAVVAEDVRRLSERVRDSVASVRSLVEEFAAAIRATVTAAEEAAREVERVRGEAASSAGALEAVRDTLLESADVARQISLVTRQQTAASEEVVSTLREFHQVVQRMSRDLAQLTETAGRLRRVGLSLQMLAQSFRLESPRSLKQLAESWRTRLAAAGGERAEALLAELLAGTPFVEAAYLVDPRGRLEAIRLQAGLAERAGDSLAELRRADLSARPWFRAALESGRATVTPPHPSLLSREACLTVAIPRPGEGGALAGLLGLDVNLRDWAEIGR